MLRDSQWLFDVLDPGGPLRPHPVTHPIRGISIDTRTIREGEVFFAVQGKNFDGHQFLGQAFQRGASLAVVNRGCVPADSAPCPSVCLLEVDDTILALGNLASALREGFSGKVIGIGGSNGKTSTRGLLASVLAPSRRVVQSPASFNNHIGVPLTIFELLRHPADILLLEMGTNHAGEMDHLCRIAQPDAAILTNIGPEHLEFFLTLDGVAQEEFVLPGCLSSTGWAVLNSDCPYTDSTAPSLACQVRTVGWNARADLRISHWSAHTDGAHFSTQSPTPGWSRDWHVPAFGRHQSHNAAMAIEMARMLGLSPADVTQGLQNFKPAPMRMECDPVCGIHFIMDCYNANPGSVRAALESLSDFPVAGRRHMVLGELGEMGAAMDPYFSEIVDWAAASGLDNLIVVGSQAHRYPLHRSSPSSPLQVRAFETQSLALPWIISHLEAGDGILFKASRSSFLERLAHSVRSALQSQMEPAN